MIRALIVYGSTTGNTQNTAEMIGDVLEGKGWEIVMKSVDETSVEELTWDYDLFMLGSSTWGDDEIEMQEDFAEFYEKMDEVSLNCHRRLSPNPPVVMMHETWPFICLI
jgi:flavodoxin